jgi:hypothetical protein
MRRTSLIVALVAALAMLATLASAASASSGTDRQITLHPSVSFPHATGTAHSKTSTEERELDVEAQHLSVLAGKHVNVFVNGNKWASPLVNSLGHISVDRSTQRGQFVPLIKAGSIVRVRTLGGTLIVGGSF